MLEVKELTFRYPETETIWRFTFGVDHGECIAINGPSGSGKSTLLNLLAGFLTPESGTIRWENRLLNELPPWERPVTSLFQEHNLFEHLDVQTNIGLGIHPGLKLTRTQTEAISHGLVSVGMTGFERRMPGDLSGGQRQRVALLRALLRDQPILLLDEPLTGLDAEARTQLRALLLRHKAAGKVLVLASHDQEDRKILADKLLNL